MTVPLRTFYYSAPIGLLPELYRCNNCDQIGTSGELRVIKSHSGRTGGYTFQAGYSYHVPIAREIMLCWACKPLYDKWNKSDNVRSVIDRHAILFSPLFLFNTGQSLVRVVKQFAGGRNSAVNSNKNWFGPQRRDGKEVPVRKEEVRATV